MPEPLTGGIGADFDGMFRMLLSIKACSLEDMGSEFGVLLQQFPESSYSKAGCGCGRGGRPLRREREIPASN